MPTRSRAYVGDVACVAPFGARGTLLAGAGASIHRFALGTDGARGCGASGARRVASAAVFEAQGVRVHGVRDLRDGETCAVWGERRVRVMRLRDGDGDGDDGDGDGWTAETPFAPFAAWVHDVRGIADDDGARGRAMAIGFSDNAVELWRRDAEGDGWTRAERVECESRCLLYTLALSASETWAGMTVAAGTIFNDVQLWCVRDGAVRVKCVGHEGSLMRVRFGEDGDVVYSSSDDRTARVWDVPENAMDSNTCVSVRPSAVLAGHVARVWDCVRIDGERPVYATAGEDCTVRVWDANNARGTETLEQGVTRRPQCELAVLRGHRGRGIWRVCKLKAFNGDVVLASAGADGSVKIWNMSDWTSASAGQKDSMALHESVTPCPDGKITSDDAADSTDIEMHEEPAESASSKKRKKKSKRRKSLFGPNDEYIRAVRIARYGVIYVATNCGILYRVTISSKGAAWVWERVCESASPLMSMSVERTDDSDVVAVSDLEGIIKIAHISCHTGSCTNLISFRASETRVLMDVFLKNGYVFASIVGGVIKCWRRDEVEQCVFTLRNPYKHRILALDYSEELQIVAVGDQKGNLCVFDANTKADDLVVLAKKWSAHEKASSINACEIHPGPVFMTGGRDSNACCWSVSGDGELVLDTKWTAPSKASVLFLSATANGDFSRAAGFRETDFVAYSVSDQRQMIRIPCHAQNVPHDVFMGDGDRIIFVHRYKTSLHISMRWSEQDVVEDKSGALWSHG